MLEAVNSTLQNAQVLKPVVAQTSTSESLSANPDRVQKSASAPFLSPFIFVDSANEQVILQIRNNETGDAISQYPSGQYARPESVPKDTQPSQVALQAQAEIDAQSSAPSPEVQQQAQQPAPTPQQTAAFANAAASGFPLESAGVSFFA